MRQATKHLQRRPLGDQLDERTRRRLVNARALCIGAEAFIVLRDLCQLTLDEAEDTLLWAGRALLASSIGTASLDERNSRP